MADITSTSTFADAVPNLNVKMVYVVTPDTEGAGATVTIPNMTTVYMVLGVDVADGTPEESTVATNVVTITNDVPAGVRMIVVGL